MAISKFKIATAEELARCAKGLKLAAPVLTVEDFNASFKPLRTDQIDRLVVAAGGAYVAGEDGVLYSATDDFVGLSSVLAAMGHYFSTSPHSIPVTLVVHAVLSQVYDACYGQQSANEEGEESVSTRSDAQQMLDTLIGSAAAKDATDIHITIYGEVRATVQFRISGLLHTQRNNARPDGTWNAQNMRSLCAAAVNAEAAAEMGSKDFFSTHQPMDASFTVNTASGRRKVRYSHVPNVQGGIKAVIRLLSSAEDGKSNIVSLEHLGYMTDQSQLIEQVSMSAHGLVLVCGPTGSGKSTTLHSCLSLIPQSKAVYTYEDPVESLIPGATQVPVAEGAAEGRMTYTHLSKNTLRMDPDAIMYGELRNNVVAQQTVHAATTGHLVLTTLHTQSAVGAITRLCDMGIENTRLAEPGFLRLIVFQRLLPKTCKHCSVVASEHRPTSRYHQVQMARISEHFHGAIQMRIANTSKNNSCVHCDGSGFKGVVLVAEVVVIDHKARSYIAANDLNGWLKTLHEKGWMSVKDHAELYVRSGVLCPVNAEAELSDTFGKTAHDGGFDYSEYRNMVLSKSQDNAGSAKSQKAFES